MSEDARDTCIPIFYTTARLNGGESKREGRDIYRDVDFVQIIIPGDNNSLVDRPVLDHDKERWPRQWEAFERKQQVVMDGMPIDNWPMLRPHQVAECKAMAIFTVEALANIGDDAIRKLGDWGRKAQTQAIMWGDQAKAGQEVTKLITERDQLKTDLLHLRGQFDDLKAASEEELRRHRRIEASMSRNNRDGAAMADEGDEGDDSPPVGWTPSAAVESNDHVGSEFNEPATKEASPP